jgi:hypothetical protein
MESNYEVKHSDGIVWYDIHSKFHIDWYRPTSNTKVLPQNFQILQC